MQTKISRAARVVEESRQPNCMPSRLELWAGQLHTPTQGTGCWGCATKSSTAQSAGSDFMSQCREMGVVVIVTLCVANVGIKIC
jgi:hypothetical protein